MANISECGECQDWRGCPGHDWYGYHEIRWCPQQIFWILKYEFYFHAGEWPTADATADPEAHHRVVRSEAAFVKAAVVIAEIDARLAGTGWRGRLLVEESYKREKMLYLSDDAKSALYYVAGPSRKTRGFGVWRKDREYRRKSDIKVVLSTT